MIVIPISMFFSMLDSWIVVMKLLNISTMLVKRKSIFFTRWRQMV